MSGQKSNIAESKKLHNPKSHAPAVFIPCWLIQVPHKLLSFGAKLLYGRLAQWSNTNGDVFRSAPQLSKELGIGVRTIEKFIKELKDVELIETYHPQAGGQNHFRFFDHEWMHDKLVEELDPPHNHAVPPAQPCGTPPNNHADINIKEVKEIKDISESVDSSLVTQSDLINIYIEELPTLSHPRNPQKPSKELARLLNTLTKRWPVDISEKGNQLTKDTFRALIKKLKEIDYWMFKSEKDAGMIAFCRISNMQRAIERLIAHDKQGKR